MKTQLLSFIKEARLKKKCKTLKTIKFMKINGVNTAFLRLKIHYETNALRSCSINFLFHFYLLSFFNIIV